MNRRNFVRDIASALSVALLARKARAAGPVANMKQAVLISMLPKELSYRERFQLAADVGFEAVEAQTITDPKEADEIKEASMKSRVRIHSVMNMDHWKFPLSSADPEVVATSMKGMETSLRNAKLWGADAVLLVPAVVNSETSYRDAYVRSQAQVKKLIPLAKELGVIIAVEEVWNKFLLSPLEFAKYVDEFQSPFVKAYFDVGNIVLYGFPQDWIRTLGSRIHKIHLKDFNTKTKEFVPLREGSVEWPEVVKALGEINFNGYLTVELPAGDERYLRDVNQRVKQILAS